MLEIKNTCKKPLLISFEGIEGMGKSTQIQLLYDFLKNNNIQVIKTREPGGTPLGEGIRNCLLQSYDQPLDALTELSLLLAARRYHLKTVIEPALAQGCFVLVDRFKDASRAYQGFGRGLSLELIDRLHVDFGIEREPDLTVLLDGPVTLSGQRLTQRGGQQDRIEQESQLFFEKVRQGYLHLAQNNAERFLVLPAQQESLSISQKIVSTLMGLL